MKIIYLFLCTAFIFSFSCAQNREVNHGQYFKVSATDSVSLKVYDNLDTSLVTKMISEEKKDLIIYFEGITNLRSTDILQVKFLKNKKIVNNLKSYKIVRLFVDYKIKAHPNDRLTIGEKNMLYQRNRFRMTMQPYYVIYKSGMAVCTGTYISDPKEFLEFLEGCKRK